jgi:hypothetical protein
MRKTIHVFARRLVPLISAGMLFQASGCTLDARGISAGVIGAVLQSFIESYVFGAFNLIP